MFPFGRQTKGVNTIEMPQQSEQMHNSTWHLSVNQMGKQHTHISTSYWWQRREVSVCVPAKATRALSEYLPLPAYRAFLYYLRTIGRYRSICRNGVCTFASQSELCTLTCPRLHIVLNLWQISPLIDNAIMNVEYSNCYS